MASSLTWAPTQESTIMTRATAQPERSSGAASARPTITLTGVQPTGDLHLGNYIGAIQPLAELAADSTREVYVFLADLHALNSRPDPAVLRDRCRRLLAALLACGLDRPNVHVYRQSRVPAVACMAVLLGNVAAKGLLNRAHAYKAAVAGNVAAGRDPDHGVNMGLYSYPVLMAADILALDADEVPVGADQAQHLEIAVDLAQRFSRSYRTAVLREPRALIARPAATIPGLDGRKMSKSYGNAIPLMAEPADMGKQIRRIVTDSTPPEQSKDPDTCTLVALLRAFADPGTVATVEERYRTGGIGYGEVKARLTEAIDGHVTPMRNRYQRLLADAAGLEARLADGEQRARRRSEETLARTMLAVGL
jgi:tryptophanyl-tRNA synthetase